MAEFQYTACTSAGETEEGSIDAPDQQQAVAILQSKGKIVIKINPVSATGSILSSDVGSLMSKVGMGQILEFTTETDTLLAAGMPLEKALRLQAELCTHPKFSIVLNDLVQKINEGKSFSEALQEQNGIFDDYYISMVRGGEASGTLNVILSRLADYMQKRQKLKSTIIGAIIYPSILLSVSLLAVVVMMSWVIPKFKDLFQEQTQLPLVTRIVLTMSNSFISYWWVMLLLLVLAGVIYKIAMKTEKGRLGIGRVLLKLPVAGNLIRESEAVKFCRMLSTMLEGQVPILQSVSIAIASAGNEPMALLLKNIYHQIQSGKPMGSALSGSIAFPELAARMISLGEESGELVMMLGKIADRFEYKVEKTTAALISLLEPAIIVFLGGFIGFIVVGIMLAIMSASKAVG